MSEAARLLQKPILNFDNLKAVLLVAWLIFLAAFGLRVNGIGEYPPRHATDDEFHYLWAGLNFWDRGELMSWSGLSDKNRVGIARMDDHGYVMVSPAFDHPPLFTLSISAVAKLFQPERIVQRFPTGRFLVIWDFNLGALRFLMLPLFAACFWLLYFITKEGFGSRTALLTILLYGFMSHAATHGRLILADNLCAVWLLASVWAVQSYLKDKMSRRRMGILVVLTTAAALLTKVPAVCQVPVLMIMFIYARRFWEIGYVLGGLALGGALYLAWVIHFGLEDFLAVMGAQITRFRGFNAFHLISGAPRLLDIIDLNGILLAGWFCSLAQVLRPRIHILMLVLPVYMLAFTFFAGDVMYGWYSLSLYPWLALAVAVTTVQVFRRPHMGPAIGWLLLFLPYCFQSLYIARVELRAELRLGYVVAVAILLLSFAFSYFKAARVMRMAMVAILSLVLLREVYEVSFQRQDRDSDQGRYF